MEESEERVGREWVRVRKEWGESGREIDERVGREWEIVRREWKESR